MGWHGKREITLTAWSAVMPDPVRDGFAKALHDASELERDQKWEAAIEAYSRSLASLPSKPAGELRAMRAIALLRKGNALMELRRWEEARAALDEALHDAKASRDPAIVAQALLAAGVFAANRDDRERAEAFLLDALERFHQSDDRAARQGRGWAFLNLATLYGKTGRLDLAFVTFTKAQDVLGAAEDWAGVAAAWEAQAQLRRAIQDEDRWREDLGEAILFYDRANMKAKSDRLRALVGKRLV
jgi:tetratricopeptide (TPR) repeat protein